MTFKSLLSWYRPIVEFKNKWIMYYVVFTVHFGNTQQLNQQYTLFLKHVH